MNVIKKVGLFLSLSLAACSSDDGPKTSNTGGDTHTDGCVVSAGGVELCDGLDNNCDGVVDDGFNVGQSCNVGMGPCASVGTFVCADDKATAYCKTDSVMDAACGDLDCDVATGQCVCDDNRDCSTAVCDTDKGICVTCITSVGCDEGEVCDIASDRCVECLEDGDCSTGVCKVDSSDSANNMCVTCLEDKGCSTGVCKVDVTDSANNVCVTCLTNENCTDPSSSVCMNNECVGCSDDDNCEHIDADYVCNDEVCVQCTTNTEDINCKKPDNIIYSCDISTHICSEIPKKSAGTCQPCVSNTSCFEGYACVPTTYNGNFAGNYCMMRSTGATCPAPYGADVMTRTDVSGNPVDVCMIRESITSCDAYRQYEDICTNDASVCSAPGSACKNFNAITKRCTYPCISVSDCKNGVMCKSTNVGDFCGAATVQN